MLEKIVAKTEERLIDFRPDHCNHLFPVDIILRDKRANGAGWYHRIGQSAARAIP